MTEHRTGVLAARLGACVSLFVLGCSGKISGPAPGSGATGAEGGTSSVGGSAGAGGSGAGKATGGTGNAGGASGSATGGTSGTGTGGTSAGSSGTGGEPSDEECAAQSGAALKVGRSRLSRLTRSQLAHTLRDLLNVTGNETDSLTPDQSVGPFASNALAEVTDLIVQQHQELAAKIA